MRTSMSIMILMLLFVCCTSSVEAGQPAGLDRVGMIRNNTLYSFDISDNAVTTVSEVELIDIDDTITQDSDSFLSNSFLKSDVCGRYNNYLFTAGNTTSYFGFRRHLFSYDPYTQIMTSKTLNAKLSCLGTINDDVISVLCDGSVARFDVTLEASKPMEAILSALKECESIEFSRDGKLLGTCSGGSSKTVAIINIATGDVMLEVPGTAITFMKEFALIRHKSGEDFCWAIYDLSSYKLINCMDGDQITISMDGTCLFNWNSFSVMQDEVTTHLRQLKINESIKSVTFSLDNQNLYILSSHLIENHSGSESAIDSLRRVELTKGDTEGRVVLKLSGKPVNGSVLWALRRK